MRKNPGRKYRRNLAKQNRTERSDKKKAINERRMLWLSRLMHGKKENRYA